MKMETGRVRTARRKGDRRELAQVRRWFADVSEGNESGQTPPQSTPASDQASDTRQQTFDREYVEDLRQQAARYRRERNEALAALTAEANPQQDERASETPAQANDSELSQRLEALEAQLAERDAQIERERMNTLRLQIANEVGLPAELAGRLQGDDADAIRADAAALVQVVAQRETPRRTTAAAPGGPPARETIAERRARRRRNGLL